VAVVLLAFALRIYRLDYQSLWSDEGASVVMANRSAGDIVEQSAGDIHPPGYYLLLHTWTRLAGTSEFGLRYLSVALGLALVAVTERLGHRLLDRPAALAGALLAGISPLLIHYGQEARMYTLLALLCAVSTYLMLGYLRSPPPSWRLALFVAASAGALYSQYFAGAILALQNLLFFIVWGVSRLHRLRTPSPFPLPPSPSILGWLAAQAAVALLFVPWVLKAWPTINSWPATSEPYALAQLVSRVLPVFSFGSAWDTTTTGKTIVLVLALLVAGVAWPLLAPALPQTRERWRGLAIILLLAVGPVLVMYLLSVRRPFYHPKFLLPAVPFFSLWLACGVVALAGLGWRMASLIRLPTSAVRLAAAAIAITALGAVGFAQSRAAEAYYSDPKYARDDYRGLARYVERQIQPGDAVVLNAPGQSEIFGYYYRGDAPFYPLPTERPAQRDSTERRMAALAAEHRRLWLVLWATRESDPEGFVQGWLHQHAFPGPGRWFGDVQLVVYGTPEEPPVPQTPTDSSRWEGGVDLVSYDLLSPAIAPAPARATVTSGGGLNIRLRWQARAQPEAPVAVSVQLLDPQRRFVWAQHDARLPTAEGAPGDAEDRHMLLVPWGTPPATYRLEVNLYDPRGGQRRLLPNLGAGAADHLLLTEIAVAPPRAGEALNRVEIPRRISYQAGPLRLLGFDLSNPSSPAERGPTRSLRPGQTLHLVLAWEAASQPDGDLEVTLALRDGSGRLAWQAREPILGSLYPTSRWRAGDVWRDPHILAPDVPEGRYDLVLLDPQGSPVPLQQLEVRSGTGPSP